MYRHRRGFSFGNLIAFLLLLAFVGGAVVTFLLLNTDLLDTLVASDSAPAPLAEQAIPTTTAPTAAPVVQSESAIGDARILIPSAGVNTPIIRVYLDGVSWDVSNLGQNVGHLQGTVWMGEPGNIVLSGHVEMRDGRKGIFANLGDLVTGDVVILERDEVEQRYLVSEIRNVAPDDLTPLYPTTTERLTLITCDDYNFLSDSYEERTIVVAERIG